MAAQPFHHGGDDATCIARSIADPCCGVIGDDRINAKRPYVGTTRGRHANHIHTATPVFNPEQHGPFEHVERWSPTGAVAAALDRQPDQVCATTRRREVREISNQTHNLKRNRAVIESPTDARPSDPEGGRAAAAMRRLQ
jgi:hypothetical protein